MIMILSIMLFFSPWGFSILILRMVDKAAKLRMQPVQYVLLDLFSLALLIQLPYAVLMQIADNETSYPQMVLATFFAGLMVLLWKVTIETVSRAGITTSAARAWISLLVIPITYVGSFLLSGLVVWFASRYSRFNDDKSSVVWATAGGIVLISLMILAYFKTRQIVREAGESHSVDDSRRPGSPFDF